MRRVFQTREILKKKIIIREATSKDIKKIQTLFNIVYQGHYPLKIKRLNEERHLWLVAEDGSHPIGAIMFEYDKENRLGKAGGGVVLPDYRSGGLGSTLLQIGVEYLTEEAGLVDAIYGTTRTVSLGPSKMVAEVGFQKMGLFPNAVQIETLEHLNLDVYLTPQALETRRKKPYLFGPFFEIYNVVRKRLKLERAYVVTERAPLKLSKQKIQFSLLKDEKAVREKFNIYSAQKRVSNSFFPFHSPNWVLISEDQGTEVFLWYGGVGKQASVLGYRTDRVNTHDILDSVALALQNYGAAYVELLVDAYNYMLQQEAYTARYIPSAYFPALHLSPDGKRDDYFVLSRTFRLLDFTNAYVSEENYPFLQAYLRCYNDLYIQPFLSAATERRGSHETAIQI